MRVSGWTMGYIRLRSTTPPLWSLGLLEGLYPHLPRTCHGSSVLVSMVRGGAANQRNKRRATKQASGGLGYLSATTARGGEGRSPMKANCETDFAISISRY
ncbi:hypothetical protein Pmani_016139 [Petrolisthes manimaculis]|uniref:Uncharacterized protein n=1 Tax=Petrolisthes manimaculis TaxID=1843537 RepID=A0AAE1U6Q7_9EUCA|nr:hypothetical protein Pmani_016139 [Petrolisthes manimaculis]